MTITIALLRLAHRLKFLVSRQWAEALRARVETARWRRRTLRLLDRRRRE